jgi:FkbM family methyltransferase
MSTLDERNAARRVEDRFPAPRRVVALAPGELLVEAAWGGFMVVPGFNIDVAIGVARDGLHEPWTTRLVQELLRPGDIYLNAGANFGYFVCLAGRLVGAEGRVIGVEPNPHILPFLMKSLYWNGTIGNTEVFGRALSDVAEQAIDFHFDPQYLGGGAARGVSRAATDGGAELAAIDQALWSPATLPRLLDGDGRWVKGLGLMVPFAARTTTIDAIAAQLALPRLDLLHLDIEGSEPLALRGAERIIAASPGLRLITEWSAGHYLHGSTALRAAFDAAWGFLTGLGYRVRLLEPRLAADGGIHVAPPLTHAAMTASAPHGDYIWLKAEGDPFQ